MERHGKKYCFNLKSAQHNSVLFRVFSWLIMKRVGEKMSEAASLFGKVPPHSSESEQTVLGAMLIDKIALEKALNKLNPEDFYFAANKEIFDAANDVYHLNRPVDLITINEELRRREKLEFIGGLDYLTGLSENIITTKNIETYCNIIKEKSTLRKLINAANEIIAKGYQDNEEIEKVIELAETRIFAISQQREESDFSHMKDIVMDVFYQLEERSKTEGTLTGITTGFENIDRMTSGLQKSDFILLAARPSMGKTALALNIAMNAAKSDASVAIFSLEMAKAQLVQRIISMESLVESNKLRTGQLIDEDWTKLANAMNNVSNTNIYIDDTPAITLFEMMSKCRRLKMEKGLDLIIIDYLQLMQGDSKSESRQQEISYLSRGLKALAREMDCPILSLSQLSRAPEQRTDHRPILSDLRESGAIEQDADVVMLLYRDEYYNKDTEQKGISEVIIAKQRNGPTGTVELAWIDRFTKFSDIPNR